MNVLEQYIDALLAEKQVAPDSEELRSEYRQDLAERIGDRLNAEMLTRLNKEDLEKVNHLLDARVEPEVLREFFVTHVPEYEAVVAKVLFDFRASYLA